MHGYRLDLLVGQAAVHGVVLLVIADDASHGHAAACSSRLPALVALLTVALGLDGFVDRVVQVLIPLLREHLQRVRHQ